MNNPTIVLNKAEQRLAIYIGKSRQKHAELNAIPCQKMGPQLPLLTHIEGAAGEIAFAKITNTYPDMNIGVLADSDVTIKTGGIDVKTTKYRSGHLLVTEKKQQKPAEGYVLMIGELPRYRCAGWILSTDVFKPENLSDMGHGTTYAIDQNDLNPINEIFDQF